MKKAIYLLLAPVLLIALLAFTNTKPKEVTEKNSALKKWEASPEGISFKKWEASPAGKKVYASEAKIRKSIKSFSNMG